MPDTASTVPDTPEYDQLVTEYGDPQPVLDELTTALDAAVPQLFEESEDA